jgi:glyoxylase-like metal-dependent hydrolase (beta-lactamase superfamily II)
MNHLEAQLDYPFADTLPESGHTLEVAPGVRWLRMGLPFALNHINLWLLEDEQLNADGKLQQGWTIIDCGISNEDTRAAWEQIFANELDGLPVLRVIATHCHPDHVGLSQWLCQRWQVPLYMSTGEYGFARLMSAGLPGADGPSMVPHFRQHGVVDPSMLAQLEARKSYYPTLVPAVPESFIRLQDGKSLEIGGRQWQIITGFGHSPEHVALYCQQSDTLISGDMVLPRISTNVSVFAIEPESDAVGAFLESLQKFMPLPFTTLVLPSHGKPFRGLQIRITQLMEHHAERLAEVKIACVTPQSAADIVPIMFRRELDMHQLTFALGEALAHLHRLWIAGELKRQRDSDGIIRFVRTS